MKRNEDLPDMDANRTGIKRHVTRKMARQVSPYQTAVFLDGADDMALLQHMQAPEHHVETMVRVREKANGSYTRTIDHWLDHLTDEGFRPQHGNDAYDMSLAGKGLALYGPLGSGKTTLAGALLLEVVRMRIENIDPSSTGSRVWAGPAMGRFADFQATAEALRKMNSEAEDDADARDAAERLMLHLQPEGNVLQRADHLVLDDLSRERFTEYTTSTLSHILRTRHNQMYPTIITTNHRPGDWPRAYGEGLGQFMQRIFFYIEFDKDGVIDGPGEL